MINIGICDDEIIIAAQMENMILDISAREKIPVNVDVFYSGNTLEKEILRGTYYDLLYLDIHMQNGDGITAAKNIRKIEEIDFIELFKKFDNMKFLNLIKQIDNKYMRSNYTLYIYKKLFELKQNEDVVNILYRTIVNHETLESIGSGIGVSKERIRQRRQKAKETFNEYVELLKDFLKVKYAKQKYFDLNSLNEIYKDEDAIVLEELLKEKNLDFIDEIDVFAFYKADKIIDTYTKNNKLK